MTGESLREETCDVVVVGTGPGGGMASFGAAAGGAKTIVIDKKSVVGAPVRCAEGLGLLTLGELGIEPQRNWALADIRGFRLFSPSGRKLDLAIRPKDLRLIVLDRVAFEQHLIDRALKEGAKLRLEEPATGLLREDGKVVGIRTTKRAIRAKVIIGADGIESRVGTWAGLHTALKLRDHAACAQYTLDGLDDLDHEWLEVRFGQRIAPRGYAWVFPKGASSANVGVMVSNAEHPAKHYADSFIAERTPQGRPTNFTVGCIPLVKPMADAVIENVMLVGDAAHMVNSATGGGIPNAMMTGFLAGKVAAEYVTKGLPLSHLKTYNPLWQERVKGILEDKYRSKEIMWDDQRLERAFRKARPLQYLLPIAPRYFIKMLIRETNF